MAGALLCLNGVTESSGGIKAYCGREVLELFPGWLSQIWTRGFREKLHLNERVQASCVLVSTLSPASPRPCGRYNMIKAASGLPSQWRKHDKVP